MTDEQIIEMAKESNLLGVIDSFHYETNNWVEEATAFAKLVAQHEREACAKLCESESSNVAEHMFGKECAAAIRARGQA